MSVKIRAGRGCWLCLRIREKIARQAELPVPPVRKSLRRDVGQTVSSVNSVSQAVFSRLLSGVGGSASTPPLAPGSRHTWRCFGLSRHSHHADEFL